MSGDLHEPDAGGGEPNAALVLQRILRRQAGVVVEEPICRRIIDIISSTTATHVLGLEAWLVNLVRAAALYAETNECNGDHDGNDGCDACAWDQLYQAVPQSVKAAAERLARIETRIEGARS